MPNKNDKKKRVRRLSLIEGGEAEVQTTPTHSKDQIPKRSSRCNGGINETHDDLPDRSWENHDGPSRSGNKEPSRNHEGNLSRLASIKRLLSLHVFKNKRGDGRPPTGPHDIQRDKNPETLNGFHQPLAKSFTSPSLASTRETDLPGHTYEIPFSRPILPYHEIFHRSSPQAGPLTSSIRTSPSRLPRQRRKTTVHERSSSVVKGGKSKINFDVSTSVCTKSPTVFNTTHSEYPKITAITNNYKGKPCEIPSPDKSSHEMTFTERNRSSSRHHNSSASTSSGYSSSSRSPKLEGGRHRKSQRSRNSSPCHQTVSTQTNCAEKKSSSETAQEQAEHEYEEIEEHIIISETIKQPLSEDDLTCAICLEIIYRPRQLKCKHVFCLLCLQKYANTCKRILTCPSCREISKIPANGVKNFTRNRELEKNVRRLRLNHQQNENDCCSNAKCQSYDNSTLCDHCGQKYCAVCIIKHSELIRNELELLQTKLMQGKQKIIKSRDEDEEYYIRLEATIEATVSDRVNVITQQGKELTKKIDDVRNASREKSSNFSSKIENALSLVPNQESQNIVDLANFYTELNILLTSIPHFKQPQLAIDLSSLTLNEVNYESSQVKKGANSEGSNNGSSTDEEDLATIKNHSLIYRTKSSQSKNRWGASICGRPTCVVVSPWSGHLYVTGSDACKVFIFDMGGKSVGNFGSRGHGEGSFLCPAGLAFSLINGELLVTDKWKHCILVFDQHGLYLRQMGNKGRGFGQFSSPEGIATDGRGNIYVADTCNNRIQVLDCDGLFLREIGSISSVWEGGWLSAKRELNEPVAVAVSEDSRMVYVADSADHRIKVFDATSGRRLVVFGSRGSGKGQLDCPEAIAVDCNGFIVVGDSGNGRVQVFRPSGHFVRFLGTRSDCKGEFGWVSGVAVSKDGEVVVTDFQNSQLTVF